MLLRHAVVHTWLQAQLALPAERLLLRSFVKGAGKCVLRPLMQPTFCQTCASRAKSSSLSPPFGCSPACLAQSPASSVDGRHVRRRYWPIDGHRTAADYALAPPEKAEASCWARALPAALPVVCTPAAPPTALPTHIAHSSAYDLRHPVYGTNVSTPTCRPRRPTRPRPPPHRSRCGGQPPPPHLTLALSLHRAAWMRVCVCCPVASVVHSLAGCNEHS